LIFDSRTLPVDTVIETDLCMVGAGAAGITLAREFLHQPFRVYLLECGGLRPDRDTQSVFAGTSIGLPYFDLEETRQGCYGGTTSIWTGWCRPLDPIDFEARPWVPHSGWPFNRAHLEPFYRRAQEVCQLGPRGYEAETWEGNGAHPLPLAPDLIRSEIFQFSAPTRFGRVYRDEIARAGNIHTLLHAHAIELVTMEASGAVSAVRVATLEGRRFRVRARVFVLAAGGIENPRLLLLSRRGRSAGLGNGLVGRFFMDHPYVNSGWHLLPRRARLDFYRIRRVTNFGARGKVIRVFTFPEAVLRRERLVNVAVFYRPVYHAYPVFGSEAMRSLGHLLNAARGRSAHHLKRDLPVVAGNLDQVILAAFQRVLPLIFPPDRLPLRAFAEPVPNPESRITLGEDRDPLGRRRVLLDWKLSPLELHSVARAHQLLDQALRRAGEGQLETSLVQEAVWPSSLSSGRHHIGTTRMHDDPRFGVVDAHCRVHGVPNLFIAGSSVFPTAGYANPTLTIVALALRLAGHLTRVMAA
jgi:choline dehydrogenase-like flavoprotein